VTAVLFVGAGRHQRRAIARVRQLGVRVVAVDRNADAPGLVEADVAEVVDFAGVDAVVEVGRRHGVEGVLTVAADRAVPVVAAVADRLGLPSIGTDVAHRMTDKLAMRRALAEAHIPQPRFAPVSDVGDARDALAETGTPAVVKPADSSGQRGLSRVDAESDLDAALDAALDASPTGTAMLEELVEGVERNTMAVVRAGEPSVLTVSDRVRPDGRGFGVALAHVYPSSLDAEGLAAVERLARETVRAVGLQDGIAYPQLIVSADGRVVLIEVAARIPGGQMGDVVRVGTGVDLVEVAVLQALGRAVPDELVTPSVPRPLAVRFLTAEPGPLRPGRVTRVGSLERVLAADGVVQAETYLQLDETIRPVTVDADRRGYVIAVADTPAEALSRADAAAALLDVEVMA
jgi:biotin carboxylase